MGRERHQAGAKLDMCQGTHKLERPTAKHKNVEVPCVSESSCCGTSPAKNRWLAFWLSGLVV